MAPFIFMLFGCWYGVAFPVFWPLAAVFVGSLSLVIFRGFTESMDEGGVITVLTELIGRNCWIPFALGAIVGAFFRVLQ
jgi:hypothetical protein